MKRYMELNTYLVELGPREGIALLSRPRCRNG